MNQKQKTQTNKEYKTPEDKIPIKMLYMELGPSETARRMGLKIGSVTKWASRYQWTKDKLPGLIPRTRTVNKGGRPQLSVATLSHGAETAPEALKQMTQELATRTRTALAQAATAAAEAAAKRQEPLPVQSTAQLRELAAAAGRVFGWDENNGPSTVHNNLVITTEQLKQIRALRDA